MNPLTYLKEKGLRRACQVIWRFKLPKIQVSIVALLTRGRTLENKIVIESHNDFDCNGGALYDWLIENGYNDRIKIVWRLYHDAPAHLPKNVSCVPVYGPSWKKAWAICTAKWLTADCTVADKVRQDQVSVYTTHAAFSLKETKGLVEVSPSVDYVLGLTPEMDDYFIDECGIDAESTEILHLGYPDLDRLFSGRHTSGYASNTHSAKKVILWMPTFRKGVVYGREDSNAILPYGIPLIDSESRLIDLNELLAKLDTVLVVKLHPKQDVSSIGLDKLSNVVLLTGDTVRKSAFDNYDLMLEASALISDYSGAAYQYLVLNRPLAFVLSDLDEYKIGLINHPEDYMPGSKIMTYEGLCSFIREVAVGSDCYSEERRTLRNKFYGDCDARSCERLVRFLGILSGDEKDNG